MTAIREKLQGYKTYIIAAIAVLAAVLAWLNGDAGLFEALDTIMIALGLGTLRAGVKTDTGTGG